MARAMGRLGRPDAGGGDRVGAARAVGCGTREPDTASCGPGAALARRDVRDPGRLPGRSRRRRPAPIRPSRSAVTRWRCSSTLRWTRYGTRALAGGTHPRTGPSRRRRGGTQAGCGALCGRRGEGRAGAVRRMADGKRARFLKAVALRVAPHGTAFTQAVLDSNAVERHFVASCGQTASSRRPCSRTRTRRPA